MSPAHLELSSSRCQYSQYGTYACFVDNEKLFPALGAPNYFNFLCDLIILWKHFESDSHVPHSLHAVVEKKESQENGSRTNYQRESWWQHHSEETQNRITQTQEK